MIKYILTALAVGVVAGYLNGNWGLRAANSWVSDGLFNVSLYALLFVMGLALVGQEGC